MKKELVLTNDPAEIGKIAPFVEEIGQELALTQEEVFNLNLALEEAAANVIHYAYADESGKTCSANEKKCRIKAEKAQGLLTSANMFQEAMPAAPSQQVFRSVCPAPAWPCCGRCECPGISFSC